MWTVFHSDLIKPSNSLPTDILANGDMKALLTDDTNGSENPSTSQNNATSDAVQAKENSPTSNNNVGA